jgi:hypothetical protein
MTIDDGDVNSNNHVWGCWARDFSFAGAVNFNGNTSYATPFAPGGIAGSGQLQWRDDGLCIVQNIPEPAALALLGLGGSLVWRRRR